MQKEKNRRFLSTQKLDVSGTVKHINDVLESSVGREATALKEIKGFEKESFLAAHQQEKPITSVRFNPFKKNNLLNDALVLEEQVPWSSQGYYLQARPSFRSEDSLAKETTCYSRKPIVG
jgi:hypothetical protein